MPLIDPSTKEAVAAKFQRRPPVEMLVRLLLYDWRFRTVIVMMLLLAAAAVSVFLRVI